jgi:hypothetical protein
VDRAALRPNGLTGTVTHRYNDLDGTAQVGYALSGDTTAVTWDADARTVTAVGNGTVDLTVSIPETDNYQAAQSVVSLSAIAQPITGPITVTTTQPDDALTAELRNDTIVVSGTRTRDAAVTITPQLYTGLTSSYQNDVLTVEENGQEIAAYPVDLTNVTQKEVTTTTPTTTTTTTTTTTPTTTTTTTTTPATTTTTTASSSTTSTETSSPATHVCPSADYSDLDISQWYHEAVDYVLTHGQMTGYEDGRFGPDDALTRAQTAQILYQCAGRPAVSGTNSFADVADGAWYADAVTWATGNGIVTGYENGSFGPNDQVTREQLAVMLWHYAGSPVATSSALTFVDADAISPWALDAIRWATEQGILSGYPGNDLRPGVPTTRSQAAQMLQKLMTQS